jgi:hypothetical protein
LLAVFSIDFFAFENSLRKYGWTAVKIGFSFRSFYFELCCLILVLIHYYYYLKKKKTKAAGVEGGHNNTEEDRGQLDKDPVAIGPKKCTEDIDKNEMKGRSMC